MIGQVTNRTNISKLIKTGMLSRFIIIVGEEGSGKKTLSRWIAHELDAHCVVYDNKTDSVKQAIDLAYKQTRPIVYCIENYQSMNNAARSALLKVTEEPPNSAYIIMTTTSDADILDTLKSRSFMIAMEDYSHQELLDYCVECNLPDKYTLYSRVPGHINRFEQIDYNKFEEFVNNVWNNITKAAMGNVLKLSSFFRIKDSEVDNYDIDLFINAFTLKVTQAIRPNIPLAQLRGLTACVSILGQTQRQLQRSYSKQPLVDNMLLTLRTGLYGIV